MLPSGCQSVRDLILYEADEHWRQIHAEWSLKTNVATLWSNASYARMQPDVSMFKKYASRFDYNLGQEEKLQDIWQRYGALMEKGLGLRSSGMLCLKVGCAPSSKIKESGIRCPKAFAVQVIGQRNAWGKLTQNPFGCTASLCIRASFLSSQDQPDIPKQKSCEGKYSIRTISCCASSATPALHKTQSDSSTSLLVYGNIVNSVVKQCSCYMH